MSWKNHNTWSRWLVLSACAPKPANGRISLSEVGRSLDFVALSRAIVPAIVPGGATDDWIDQLWQNAPSDAQREALVSYLQWLVWSDAASAKKFMELTHAAQSTAEAWRTVATFSEDTKSDAQRHILHVAHQHIAGQFDSSKRPCDECLTSSQMVAYEGILAMARAYFLQMPVSCSISPRLAPLVIGQTGSGKSSLLRRVARDLNVGFYRTSVGEWIPTGARDVRTSLRSLIDLLVKHPAGLIVFVDELDKTSADQSSWTRSSMNEIFSVLDRSFFSTFAAAGKWEWAISEEEVELRANKKLFFSGAGTWQRLWSHSNRMGFGVGEKCSVNVIDQVANEKVVPIELLMRFSWPPFVLEFPGPEETGRLFDATGLTALASQAGVDLNPAAHDWTRGGLRSLESLAGALLIRCSTKPVHTPAHTRGN